jgi:AcrR family transcriptional regulator
VRAAPSKEVTDVPPSHRDAGPDAEPTSDIGHVTAGECAGSTPSVDPRCEMSPAASNILAAAQRVLVDKGFSGLTLRAVAQESGQNSAMVQYYFGNKEGLVKAMIDSVFRDDQQEAAAAMSAVASEDRLPRFVDGLRTISSSRSFRVFFDILPYALRVEGLRDRMALAYDDYRRIKADWLAADGEPSPAEQEALLGLAELMTAVVDGLAIQEVIDDEFDMRRAYAVLEFMLQRCLPDLLEAGLPEDAEQSFQPA